MAGNTGVRKLGDPGVSAFQNRIHERFLDGNRMTATELQNPKGAPRKSLCV